MERSEFSPSLGEFDAIAASVQAQLSCGSCLISVMDADALYALGLTAEKGAEATDEPGSRIVSASDTICQHTIALRRPVSIPDITEAPWLMDAPTVKAFDIGAYLGVPLTLSDGHTIGAICAIANGPRVWSRQEIDYLSEMGKLAADKIELCLLQQETNGHASAHDETDRIIAALAQFRSSAISVHGRDGELLFVNRGMVERLGLSGSDMMHLPTELIRRIGAEEPTGGMQVCVAFPDHGDMWLRVEWSRTHGGLILCDWWESQAPSGANAERSAE